MTYPRFTPPLVGAWSKLAALLIVGYLGMGRAFAYFGLPWIGLYIGEMALMAFILMGPRAKQGRWFRLAWRAKRLKRLKWLLALSLLYGGFEALRGIAEGYPVLTAIRDTAFNYYPLFFFFGVWAAQLNRNFLRRVIRMLAWWNGCFGLACVLFLSRLPWLMPGTDTAASPVSLFSGPYGASAVALLGLLMFEPKPSRVWHLIALNLFVLLGLLVRAEWVGLMVGVFLFALLTKRIRLLALSLGAAAVLIAALVVMNLRLPSPRETGGAISARYILARAVAAFNKDFAEGVAPQEDVGEAAETAEWRLIWWAAILGEVHGSLPRTVFGLGYGYPIGDLNPFIQPGTFIQTPHNDFFYVLGYSGWLGVALFALLQIEIARLLWGSYRLTNQPFGLVCWAALLGMSLFEDFFEAPYAAIPFYLLVGAAAVPALLGKEVSAPGERKLSRNSLGLAATSGTEA